MPKMKDKVSALMCVLEQVGGGQLVSLKIPTG